MKGTFLELDWIEKTWVYYKPKYEYILALNKFRSLMYQYTIWMLMTMFFSLLDFDFFIIFFLLDRFLLLLFFLSIEIISYIELVSFQKKIIESLMMRQFCLLTLRHLYIWCNFIHTSLIFVLIKLKIRPFTN